MPSSLRSRKGSENVRRENENGHRTTGSIRHSGTNRGTHTQNRLGRRRQHGTACPASRPSNNELARGLPKRLDHATDYKSAALPTQLPGPTAETSLFVPRIATSAT